MSNETIAVLQLVAAGIAMAANVVLAFLTYRYVKLTAGMLDHVRSAQAGSVAIDLTFRQQVAYLAVTNTGTTPATDIAFKELSGFDWSRHSSLATLRERGISYLPAGRTMQFGLGPPDWIKLKDQPPPVKVALSFRADGKQQDREFVIDMLQYSGTSSESAPDERLVRALDRLREGLPGQDPPTLLARLGIFRPSKKACVACAESIPLAAKLCSHCNTTQPAAAQHVADSTDSTQDRPPAIETEEPVMAQSGEETTTNTQAEGAGA